MKKLSAIILWCLLAILSGCTTAQFDKHHSSDSSPEPKLSLEEAKAAFEETYSIALTKSGSGNGHRNKLSPGEFTPLWDNAAYSENPKACSYDVKLITERKVYAIVAEFRNGKSAAEKVQVHQRLVTIKNESYPRTCCYILSLIPDYGCDGGDRMEERFRCCSDKGLFSGLAVYSALGSSAILRIDRYRNGTRLDGVYIPAGNGSKESRLEKAASMLRGITLINRRSVTTKSFGEDFWDDDDEWDYGDPDDYTDLGGGFFEDEDGNKYFDTDGDGMPDSMVIEGGGIDGNDDGDDDKDNNGLDDSWWLWNPNPDDNGNEGYNPEEDPYYNTNDDFDGHTGDDNNEDDDEENDEDYERGKEGIEKMQKDLKEGKTAIRTITDATLTGVGVGVNTNGIIFSAANFLDNLSKAERTTISSFGNALGIAGIAVTTAQTFITIYDGEELSTSDVLSIVSATLGGCALITGYFPVLAGVTGVLGVSSAVIGLASLFVTEGMYAIEAPNGELIYIYITSNFSCNA